MKTKTYKNGLVLLYQKNKTSQADSFHVNVLTGSALETASQYGINHLVEHLMFKSSYKRTTEQISEELEAQGALINAWTNYDNVCFYFDCCPDNLSKCAEIYADMLFNKNMTQSEFEKEKSVVCQEIAMYKDLYDATNEDNYFEHFWDMKPVIGTTESVTNTTLKKVNNFISRRYVPANMVISVFSHLSFNKICKIVNEYYGKVQNPDNYLDLRSEWKSKKVFKRINNESIHKVKNKAAQVQVIHAFNLPKNTPTVNAFYRLLLSSGMNSVLFREIREKHGFCYSISADFVDLLQGKFNENQNNVLLIRSSMEKQHLKPYLETLPKVLNDLETIITNNDKIRVINTQKTQGLKAHQYCYDMLFRYLNPDMPFNKKDMDKDMAYTAKNIQSLVFDQLNTFKGVKYEVAILGNI